MPKPRSFSIIADTAEVVELGRHAILRGWWGDPCRFESGLRHQQIVPLVATGGIFLSDVPFIDMVSMLRITLQSNGSRCEIIANELNRQVI